MIKAKQEAIAAYHLRCSALYGPFPTDFETGVLIGLECALAFLNAKKISTTDTTITEMKQTNIISAAEARKRSSAKTDVELAKVQNEIAKAIEAGETECAVMFLDNRVRRELLRFGYKLQDGDERFDPRDASLTMISWE